MSASLGINPLELNDVCGLVGFPLLNKAVSAGDAFDEGFGSHRSCDAERPKIVREVKHSPLVFETGNILADEYGPVLDFGLSKSHISPSRQSLNTSEQLPIGAYAGQSVQTINALTKSLFDERVSSIADNPANDNEPWREAA